jgi:tetratricopeptide (TPR) repeat protein
MPMFSWTNLRPLSPLALVAIALLLPLSGVGCKRYTAPRPRAEIAPALQEATGYIRAQRHSEAITTLNSCELAAQDLKDPNAVLECICLRAEAECRLGDPAAAKEALAYCVKQLDKTGLQRPDVVIRTALMRGDLYARTRREANALAEYNAALAVADEIGDRMSLARAHLALAKLDLDHRRFNQAHDSARVAEDLFERVGDQALRGEAWLIDAQAYEREDRVREAREGFGKAIAFCRRGNDPVCEAYALQGLGDMEARIGKFEPARERYGESQAIFKEAQHPLGEAGVLVAQGELERRLNNADVARRYLLQALSIYRDRVALTFQARTLQALARVETRARNETEALKWLSAARTLYTELKNDVGLVSVEADDGHLDCVLGRYEKGQRKLETAMIQFETMNHGEGVRSSRERLNQCHAPAPSRAATADNDAADKDAGARETGETAGDDTPPGATE